jgi:hypothetical protein
VAVAHHQPPVALVTLGRVRGQVVVDPAALRAEREKPRWQAATLPDVRERAGGPGCEPCGEPPQDAVGGSAVGDADDDVLVEVASTSVVPRAAARPSPGSPGVAWRQPGTRPAVHAAPPRPGAVASALVTSPEPRCPAALAVAVARGWTDRVGGLGLGRRLVGRLAGLADAVGGLAGFAAAFVVPALVRLVPGARECPVVLGDGERHAFLGARRPGRAALAGAASSHRCGTEVTPAV